MEDSGISPGEAADRRAAADEVLVAALAAGRSYAEAGRLAGVSQRTVARRMSEPDFARMVSVRRGALVGEVVGGLTALATEALVAVRACIAEGEPSVRLSAARLVFSTLLTFRQDGELEQRLNAVEERLRPRGPSEGGA